MLEAPAAFAATVAVALADIAAAVVSASIRPWRYVLSSSYRENVESTLFGRHAIVRLWYLYWGTFSLLASAAVLAGLVYLFMQPSGSAHTQLKEGAIKAAASAASAAMSRVNP